MSSAAADHSDRATDGHYTVWELASRYLEPESLQPFALTSRIHRDILRSAAKSGQFWCGLKQNALRAAVQNFDDESLLVLRTLEASPLASEGTDQAANDAESPASSSGPPHACTEEPIVRRFLRLCYKPLRRVAHCQTMLVFKNVREAASEEDAPLCATRVRSMVQRAAGMDVAIKAAYRMDGGAASSGWRSSSSGGQHHVDKIVGVSQGRRGAPPRGPRRPLLVVFQNRRDAQLVYSRRGQLRKRDRVYLERCSMPWDSGAWRLAWEHAV
ncbi:unnamed protein product [Ostreobium quekettii]|uniref:Uncharacterized protein n=1 Tax=Ostreobium quekettii TaxID=121088 RepID=A0A8S1JBK0_9CHLO|nr:unnamed protein product [Ostreobium quekettii]|eukprot:evm.model.scf_137.2 EVM.evm.TU.scf_137.2   scf_137:14963-15775(-)